jgi:hypothetical protein
MKGVIEYFEKSNTYIIILMNMPLILICGLIDFLTGIEFDFSFFYLIPISFTAWYAGKNNGIYLAIFSEIVWFSADLLGGHMYSSIIILLWNSLMRFILFMIIALLLSNFKLKMYNQYKSELLLQKNKAIIETLQKFTALIAENIINQNAKIINWINKKKNRGEKVSEDVDKASHIIGLSMQLLSEASFVYPYNGDLHKDPDKYLEFLKNKLTQINLDFPAD